MTDETFNGFSKAWTDWRGNLPARLERQDATVLARLLYLASTEDGAKQSEVERELGINQSRMSKLIDKLRAAGWITVRRSPYDRRVRILAATAVGRQRLSELVERLSAVLARNITEGPSTKRNTANRSGNRRRTFAQPGQPKFEFQE